MSASQVSEPTGYCFISSGSFVVSLYLYRKYSFVISPPFAVFISYFLHVLSSVSSIRATYFNLSFLIFFLMYSSISFVVLHFITPFTVLIPYILFVSFCLPCLNSLFLCASSCFFIFSFLFCHFICITLLTCLSPFVSD